MVDKGLLFYIFKFFLPVKFRNNDRIAFPCVIVMSYAVQDLEVSGKAEVNFRSVTCTDKLTRNIYSHEGLFTEMALMTHMHVSILKTCH